MNKVKGLTWISALVSALFITGMIIVPASQKINDYISIYRPLFDADSPRILLMEDGVDLQGDLPSRVTLDNGVQVLFDHKPDSSRFADTPRYSLFFTPDELWYQGKTGIRSFDLDGLTSEDDTTVVNTAEMGRKIDHYSQIILISAAFTLTVLIFILNFLLIAFAGGIGIMLDAFGDGNLDYSDTLNIAALFYLPMVILAVLLYKPLGISLGYYILCYILLTFVTCAFYSKRTKQSFQTE
ncbi:MAG: DUF1189 family protein [candidate division KSB1 bacterium]|nr:DUF1189 family protein [candidate division KSB1 bacterium]